MWKEFKEFAFKGNVIDLAVGVIIGGAFSTIVNSVVNDLVMPLVGAAIAGVNFADLKWTIGSAEVMYGNFIQQVVNFFIVAFCIFAAVKAINKAKPKSTSEPKPKEMTCKKFLQILKRLKKFGTYMSFIPKK